MFHSPRGFHSSPSTRRPFWTQSYGFPPRHMTSCNQTRQHAIHSRSNSSIGTSGKRSTCSYGRTRYDAHWNYHGAARTHSSPTPTKHFRLSCWAGRSLYRQNGSSLHTFWKGLNTTPAAHQPNPAVHQQRSHTTTTSYSTDHTLRSHCSLPGSLHYLNPLLRRR